MFFRFLSGPLACRECGGEVIGRFAGTYHEKVIGNTDFNVKVNSARVLMCVHSEQKTGCGVIILMLGTGIESAIPILLAKDVLLHFG